MSAQTISFGALVRARRERAGIPLNAFARDLGMSPAYLSRIERDIEKPPKDNWLLLVADKLNISCDEVFVAAGRLPPDMQGNLAEVVRIFREENR